MRVFGLIVCATISVVAVASDVSAQGADNQFSSSNPDNVRTRPHPEYDVVGVSAGKYVIYPALTVSTEHDSNLFSSKSDPVTDQAISMTPSIKINSRYARHSLNFEAHGDIKRYNRTSSENHTTHFVGLTSNLDFAESIDVSLVLSHLRGSEARGLLIPTSATTPLSYDQSLVGLSFSREFNRLKLNLGTRVQKTEYGRISLNTPSGLVDFDQQFRNNTATSFYIRSEVAMGGPYTIFIDIQQSEREYDFKVPTGSLDTSENQILVGSRFALNGAIYGIFSIGHVDQSRSVERGGNLSGWVTNTSIEWNPTRLTTLAFTLNREIDASGLASSSSALVRTVGLRGDHELRRNILLSAGVTSMERNYSDISRTDTIETWQFQTDYKMSRRRAVMLRYIYRNVSSSGNEQIIGYDESILKVGFTLAY